MCLVELLFGEVERMQKKEVVSSAAEFEQLVRFVDKDS